MHGQSEIDPPPHHHHHHHHNTHTHTISSFRFSSLSSNNSNFLKLITRDYVLRSTYLKLNIIIEIKHKNKRERERNVLFNDALNTFYLRLYGVRHMVKDHSDSEKGNPLPPHRLLLSISSKGSFICTIPQTG